MTDSNNILRIDSSVRGADSNSAKLTQYIVDQLEQRGGDVHAQHDLALTPFPAISGEDLVAIHGSQTHERESFQEHLKLSEQLIGELKQADTLVLGVPLYNFGIAASLKQWIDYIARAGVTFKYGANGPEGLSGVTDAYVVVATGGTPVGSAWDHASAHIKTVLTFIGVENIHIIDAAGSQSDPAGVITKAQQQVDALLEPAFA